MDNLQTQIRIKEDGDIEFILSSDTVDRHGTVLRQDGWDLRSFMKNPVMAYQHDTRSTDPDDFIGTWTNIRVENGQLLGTPNFEPEDLNPKAEKIRRKVEHGTIRSASVGFIPIEAHWGKRDAGEDPDVLYFDRMELLEVSLVGIPSNPDAVKRSFESLVERFPKDEDEATKLRGKVLEELRAAAEAEQHKEAEGLSKNEARVKFLNLKKAKHEKFS